MPRLFLRRAHPTFFIRYHSVVVAALGVGAASAAADPDAPTPLILTSFYDWFSITTWGWIYLAVGAVLVVGLFDRRVARVGLGVALLLLGVRLGFQLQQAVVLWQDGEPWKELLPKVAGLPLLYAYVATIFADTMEPFVNPVASPVMEVVALTRDDP